MKGEVSDYIRHQVRDIIERTESLTSHDLLIAKCIYRLNEMKGPFRCDFELCLENKDLIELPIDIFQSR